MAKAEDKDNDAGKTPGLGFAIVFIVIGLGMMVMISVSPEGLNAPMWVVQIACAAFVFAGLSMLGQVFGLTILSRLSALGVVYCLCAPGMWIAFDPLPKDCSVSTAFFATTGTDILCRTVFGAGAVITLICALAATWGAIRFIRAQHAD